MTDGGFADLAMKPLGGIEGCGCTLSDISDSSAAQLAELLAAKLTEVLPPVQNLSTNEATTEPRVAKCRQSDGGFARARFANQPQYFPLAQGHIYIVDDETGL